MDDTVDSLPEYRSGRRHFGEHHRRHCHACFCNLTDTVTRRAQHKPLIVTFLALHLKLVNRKACVHSPAAVLQGKNDHPAVALGAMNPHDSDKVVWPGLVRIAQALATPLKVYLQLHFFFFFLIYLYALHVIVRCPHAEPQQAADVAPDSCTCMRMCLAQKVAQLVTIASSACQACMWECGRVCTWLQLITAYCLTSQLGMDQNQIGQIG
jgi:hypothetical protein